VSLVAQGARIWAVANQKGGVAKTTTALALGGLLSESQQRVLLIDLDPHASMTSYAGIDPDSVNTSVYALFDESPPGDPICATPWAGIDLVPAAPALATLDRRLNGGRGQGLVLTRWLRGVCNRYDYVFMDCAPMLGVLMVNALVASDQVLLPTQTEFLSINGVRRMARTIAMLERSQQRRLSWLVVPTLYDQRTRAATQSLQSLRDEFGHNIWDEVIPVDTKLRDASRAGLPPSAYAPRTRSVLAYRKLLDYLLASERICETPA